MGSYKIGTGKEVGLALIINIKDFSGRTNKKREGSEKDVLNLTATFEYLNLKTEVKENLTHNEFMKAIDKFKEQLDKSDSDMCVVCIMSHGDEETIKSSDNCSIIIQNHIVGRFSNSSCKSMNGRPKVFLFQTCRGHEESNSVTVKSAETFTVPPDLDDLLMAFSTIPHYVAHKLMVGSPFIRIFCEVFGPRGLRALSRN